MIVIPKKKVKDEHDVGYKSLFAKKDNFLHFLKKYIVADWIDDIDENNLTPMNTSFILKDYKDKEADVIYRANIKGREIIFYVLLELQSSVDYTMPFRLLIYMTELLRREFDNTDKNRRETKSYRLPAVVPIVLYNGGDNWTAMRSFREYTEGYELFGANIIDFEYLLLDLNRSDEEFILSTNRVIDLIFALDKKDILENIPKINKVLMEFRNLKQHEQAELMGWVKNILSPRITNPSDVEKILESIERWEATEMQHNLERSLDNELLKAERKGERKAKKEAKLEREKREKEIVQNAIKMGMTNEQIARLTGLNITDVEKERENRKKT